MASRRTAVSRSPQRALECASRRGSADLAQRPCCMRANQAARIRFRSSARAAQPRRDFACCRARPRRCAAARAAWRASPRSPRSAAPNSSSLSASSSGRRGSRSVSLYLGRVICRSTDRPRCRCRSRRSSCRASGAARAESRRDFRSSDTRCRGPSASRSRRRARRSGTDRGIAGRFRNGRDTAQSAASNSTSVKISARKKYEPCSRLSIIVFLPNHPIRACRCPFALEHRSGVDVGARDRAGTKLPDDVADRARPLLDDVVIVAPERVRGDSAAQLGAPIDFGRRARRSKDSRGSRRTCSARRGGADRIAVRVPSRGKSSTRDRRQRAIGHRNPRDYQAVAAAQIRPARIPVRRPRSSECHAESPW